MQSGPVLEQPAHLKAMSIRDLTDHLALLTKARFRVGGRHLLVAVDWQRQLASVALAGYKVGGCLVLVWLAHHLRVPLTKEDLEAHLALLVQQEVWKK